MGQEDQIAAVLHIDRVDDAAVKGVSQLLVLQLGLSQRGQQPVLVAVHDLLCGKGDVDQILPQRPGEGLFQKLQVFFRLFLAQQAHGFVKGGDDLPAAVHIAAVNMADAAPVQPDAAAYFIQFLLIHCIAPFCQDRFRLIMPQGSIKFNPPRTDGRGGQDSVKQNIAVGQSSAQPLDLFRFDIVSAEIQLLKPGQRHEGSHGADFISRDIQRFQIG